MKKKTFKVFLSLYPPDPEKIPGPCGSGSETLMVTYCKWPMKRVAHKLRHSWELPIQQSTDSGAVARAALICDANLIQKVIFWGKSTFTIPSI